MKFEYELNIARNNTCKYSAGYLEATALLREAYKDPCEGIDLVVLIQERVYASEA